MLKFINKRNGVEDTFLYPKFIPRMGDTILKGGEYYKVDEVIFDDDEGDIVVNVLPDPSRTNPNKLIEQVPRASMDKVIQLLREGSKLAAVKLLKEEAKIGLKEAKDYCDEMQNNLGDRSERILVTTSVF